MKTNIKILITGIFLILISVYSILFLSALTVFEDGSFSGCLPFAICNLP